MLVGRRRHDRADHGIVLLEQLAPLRTQPRASSVGDHPVAMAQHNAAQPLRSQAGVAGRQRLHGSLRAGIDVGRERCSQKRHQHAHVEPRGIGEVGQQRRMTLDLDAGLAESRGKRLDGAAYHRIRRHHGIGVDDHDTKILQRRVTRRRQFEAISLACLQRIGTRHHIEQQRKIGGTARHRADHGQIAVERQRRQGRRCVAARRHQCVGRFVCIDAAMEGRHAQRAADVRAERQRPVAGRQRRR
ncbi:hypothetical protein ES707_09910 [subsurface metagenome]